MNQFYIKFAALVIFASLVSCTNHYYKKGKKEFGNSQYYNAIHYFEKVVKKTNNHDAKAKLAYSYWMVNDIDNADLLYWEVVKFPDVDPINMLYYSKVLISKNKCDEAKIWLTNYIKKVPNDVVAKMLLGSCNSINEFYRDTTLFTLNELKFPEFEYEFGLVQYKKGGVFVAGTWTSESYLKLYYSEKDSSGKWLNPQLLKGKINGRYIEGPATFNKAGDVAFFTLRNKKKSSKGEFNLKIYTAKLVNDKWKQLEELPFNNNEYTVALPCLSPDEKTLYFISDMPHGEGGTDIYKSTFDGTEWSNPENLGKEINTPGDELFPFMSEDGTFYFSSDAHNNMGGLDVFATSYDAKNKKWLQVENLNYPLNSTKDDFAFYINDENKSGSVSSNRKNTEGIYLFEKNEPAYWLTGTVIEKGKGIPSKGVTITIIDDNDDAEVGQYKVVTDAKGNYKIKLRGNADFIIYGSKENYFTQSVDISTKGKKYSEKFIVDFQLDEIVLEKPIVLENIYYDLDKWNIREDATVELDKLVRLLKDNPKINIEMGSHTDSRAGDQYNLVLSDKRAKACVEFLVFRGIDRNRLQSKGYGETQLVNKCKNNVECTEAEHQKNRRTEFKVTKINK